MKYIALATEDVLSEAVGIRLIEELKGKFEINHFLRKGGSGYLRSKIQNWKELSRHQCVLLITDLDRKECPQLLLNDWLGRTPVPPNLLIRIAVREIESWILADHQAVQNLMGKAVRISANPDELPDPKHYLLGLARKAVKPVSDELVKIEGAVASQGIGYNALLEKIVRECWSPERASEHSPSLRRARIRLRELVQRIENNLH